MKPYSQILTEITKTGLRAKKMGLTYMPIGRWGKNGHVLYRQKGTKLIPIKTKHPHVARPENPESNVHNSEDLMYLKGALNHHEFQDAKSTGDTCLFFQVVHTVSMQTGVPPKDILDQWYPEIGTKGLSLPEIFEGLEKNVTIKGKPLKLDVSVIDNIDDAINTVQSGSPVICIAHTSGTIMNSDFNKKDATLKIKKRKVPPGVHMYHALMLFGMDKKNKHLLFRDSDHGTSSYKSATDGNTGGFVKIDYDYVKSDPDAFVRYLSFKVI